MLHLFPNEFIDMNYSETVNRCLELVQPFEDHIFLELSLWGTSNIENHSKFMRGIILKNMNSLISDD